MLWLLKDFENQCFLNICWIISHISLWVRHFGCRTRGWCHPRLRQLLSIAPDGPAPSRKPDGALAALAGALPVREGLGVRVSKIGKFLQIFSGLVLGCIKTKFCKKICVWQHFSSSTRFTYFCFAAISKFSQKIRLKNQQFLWKFSKMFANIANIAKIA